MDVGKMLMKMRVIYGYKASELCSELGISASYLSEIENGKKQPSLELLQKCAYIYGVKLSSLVLLSEKIDDAERFGNGKKFIATAMERLIQGMRCESNDNDKECEDDQ